MRARLFALTLLAAVVVPANSQAEEPAPARTLMNNKQIMGLVDTANSGRKGNAPAALHEKDAELMVVFQGAGNIVKGGKLVDEKRNIANNLSGSSITGENSQAVVDGDMLIVPANTPHQHIPTGGAPIVLMTMHAPHPLTNWPPPN